MNVLEQVFAAIPVEKGPVTAWGQIISTDPTQVRFAGDAGDVTIALRISDYTPTDGDKVVLLRVGAQWIIIGKLVSDA